MKLKLSPHELEQLSAYLDNQLSPAERARMAARLAAEPALRAELAELRVTVAALRALPRLKVPRNFTLTPARARAARRRLLPTFTLPAMRLATALAAAAFALVFALDLTTGLQPAAPAPVAEKALTAGTPLPAPAAALPETPAPERRPPEGVAPSLSPDAGGAGGEPGGAGGMGGGGAGEQPPPPMQLQSGEAMTESITPQEQATGTPVPTQVAAAPTRENGGEEGKAPPPQASPNPYRPATLWLALVTGLLAAATLLLRRTR